MSSANDRASSWIDGLCDRFEHEFRAGGEPRIETFLADSPSGLQHDLLRELLAVEIELRQRRGELVQLDEYLGRFPEQHAVVDEFRDIVTPSPSAVTDLLASPPAHATPKSRPIPTAAMTAVQYRELQFYRRGGLGALYRARDESLNREAIVKFMNEACEVDPELVAQFKIEAEVTSRLDHPGIVPVYGSGQDDHGRPFYVMRLIHGRELKEAVGEYHLAGGPQSGGAEQRRRLFGLLEHLISACNTVAYAHHVGIVHCDLKPANIMIGRYGETFVVDWGMATSFERTTTFWAPGEATLRPQSVTQRLTEKRRGGTYGYVSPEQLTVDAAIGPASDIYSLGATLFEILTGRPPFDSQDGDVRDRIRLGRYPSPRSIAPRVCPRLEAICQKAMRIDPAERYPTAKLLSDDLANWMRDEEVLARPDRWFDRMTRFGRRHRGSTAATFAVLLTIVVSAGWILRSHEIAVHERILRAKAEELGKVQEEAFAIQQTSFTTALDTFEDLCRPLANGELSNLGVFRPLLDKINRFTVSYLENFENVESMRLHTARVYELRGTMSRVRASDSTQAVDDFRRAERLYRSMLEAPEHEDEAERRLARVRLSQGRLYLHRREHLDAQNALTAAADAFERLRRREAGSNIIERQLAEAQHGLGESYLNRPAGGVERSRALLEAETHFNQSRLLRAQLVQRTVGDERRDHQRDLARSLGYLGDLYLAQGNVGRAHVAYQQSRAERLDLYNANPLDPEHRFQYARSLANFAELERGYGGRLDDAIDQLTKAESLQHALTVEFDEVNNLWIDLGVTENLLAEVWLMVAHADATRADEGRVRCQEAIARADAVHGRLMLQNNPRGARGMAQTAVTSAVLLRESEPAASRQRAAEAVRLIESLGRESSLAGGDLVTLAMARSLSGDPASAWRILREAVARGENRAYRLERHAELGLRTLADDPVLGPQFRTLVDQIRATLNTERVIDITTTGAHGRAGRVRGEPSRRDDDTGRESTSNRRNDSRWGKSRIG